VAAVSGSTKAARGVARLRSLPVRIVGRPAARALPHTACLAPDSTLYFMTTGDVRACCKNVAHPLGNVAQQRLPEIWAGARRRDLVEHLRADDFGLGCQSCDWQVSNEGEDSIYARRFDEFAPGIAAQDPDDIWPVHLEFNISNRCNLQCVQCEGLLSSSIRIHRERLPALPKVYDEQFFDDVIPFLAHAKDIQVAGGEPFLGPESMRLFELMAEHAADAHCAVVTNATQWNRRVEAVLDAIPLTIAISIDGISKSVYESIRIGADHDQVLTNIDRFVDYTNRVGTETSFTFCLMVENYTDFGDLLLFAEERGITVDVSVVYHPVQCSLSDLDADALGRVCDELDAQSATVLPQLRLNRAAWTTELARLRQWHRFRVGAERATSEQTAETPTYRLGFRQRGAGPSDGATARTRLRTHAPDQPVHWLTVGSGDEFVACSAGAAESLGLHEHDLIGQDGDAMRSLMEARFGDITGIEVLDEDPDHLDQVITYGTTALRVIAVALRDDEGWADEVQVLFVAPQAPEPTISEPGGQPGADR